MADVVNLNAARADKLNDNTLVAPAECLEDVASEIRDEKRVCQSLLVITLNSGASGGDYDIGFAASNLRCSDMLALLEVMKSRVLASMGYGGNG